MRRKLNLGFLTVVLLLWAICVYTVLSTMSVRGIFTDLGDDVVPGAILMLEMKYKAVEIRATTLSYIATGDVITQGRTKRELLQKEWAALEKDARAHVELMRRTAPGGPPIAEQISDLSRKFISASSEIVDLKDQDAENEELLERIEQRLRPAFLSLRKVLDEHTVMHLGELSAAKTEVHAKHNATIAYTVILGIVTTLSAIFVGLWVDGQFARHAAERRQAQEQIEHLNAGLRAIRNVNQLITQEKDPDRLLQSVCDRLIETRGYYGAWMVLLDDSEKPLPLL